ncbi:carboxypeptidase-like regulatory domain-containing protein [uncultured Winogradskyella sp.]|uniref:carboxypeptidase-like regulatory domain-containing protein n=1 Tax=uncultured Winogradskyella sp. TaxID=395353 RepID=UPI0030EF4612|tara:strand:- start:131 stop:1144 length:1014 start_codon:yes stop_codon:yes gene_type:complete
MINKVSLLFSILPLFCFSQTLTGIVVDKATQQPIETVAVYFDNTTIGTTTDSQGEFSIDYTDAVQSTLVISYLGFEKIFVSDFRTKNNIKVELVEADNALDEVHIEYDDGLTRRQKLRLFRKEFLGNSKFGKSCKILNEDDLVLKYDKQNKALYASSNVALKIENKALQYEIAYDLIDFEINFRYANLNTLKFTVKSVTYFGTSFYKDLNDSSKPKTLKNRDQVYNGSVQHFMRSLYNENLRNEGYLIFYDGFGVDEWSYFSVESLVDSDFKKVTLKEKISILYNKDFQSELQLEIDEFYIDSYGNYTPIIGLYFGGAMGSQRVGDTLPLDYGISKI